MGCVTYLGPSALEIYKCYEILLGTAQIYKNHLKYLYIDIIYNIYNIYNIHITQHISHHIHTHNTPIPHKTYARL